MSSDIYAKPDLSKKVRYNRDMTEDKVEWEEREVDIYESADAIRDDNDVQSHKGGLHTERQPPAVQRRPLSAAVVCLGVLCFLMLTGIILLSIYYILDTLEKDQLQTRYDKLSNNYSQLQGTISDMTVNSSQLQSSYESLSKNHSQLQDEVKQLKSKTEGKWCPERWTRFGCSCYFKSIVTKTWFDSRVYCQEKGADLVTINNKEEQTFIAGLNMNGEAWIGLQKQWRQQPYEWEWVDESPLTETFWASGQPQSNYYAACCNKQGRWIDGDGYYDSKYWICERQLSCIF